MGSMPNVNAVQAMKNAMKAFHLHQQLFLTSIVSCEEDVLVQVQVCRGQGTPSTSKSTIFAVITHSLHQEDILRTSARIPWDIALCARSHTEIRMNHPTASYGTDAQRPS